MNQQNMSKTPSSSASELPVKRKRGRPRKDESMPRNDKRQTQTSISPAQPPPPIAATVTTLQPPPTVTMNPIADHHNMVGQVVTGVIDGVFDAGYLLSVRVGPNNTLLRGLIFQQGHFCPITPANDVAPHLKMCRREVFQIPNSNQTQLCTPQQQGACTKQPPPPQQLTMPTMTMQHYQTTPMVAPAGGSSNSAPPPPPPENLRMVEQDELMQVFEVSKMVQEPPPKNDDSCGHGLKNDHLVSDSDLMAESVPRNDVVKHPNLHCDASLVQDHIDQESVIDGADRQKRQEGENPEPITRVETGIEEQPSFGKDMLQQESEKQQGEVSKIDVNQDPNQAVASDLFQTN